MQAPTRWAPAELNELSDVALQAAVRQAYEGRLNSGKQEAPLIAPFITNGLLCRVRETLVPIVPTGTLQTSLGYVVAALTGAPRPACAETANYIGNAADARVSHWR